jgi:hypothetical protein
LKVSNGFQAPKRRSSRHKDEKKADESHSGAPNQDGNLRYDLSRSYELKVPSAPGLRVEVMHNLVGHRQKDPNNDVKEEEKLVTHATLFKRYKDNSYKQGLYHTPLSLTPDQPTARTAKMFPKIATHGVHNA